MRENGFSLYFQDRFLYEQYHIMMANIYQLNRL